MVAHAVGRQTWLDEVSQSRAARQSWKPGALLAAGPEGLLLKGKAAANAKQCPRSPAACQYWGSQHEWQRHGLAVPDGDLPLRQEAPFQRTRSCGLAVCGRSQLVLPQQVGAVHPQIVQRVCGGEAQNNFRQLSRGESGPLLLQHHAQHFRGCPWQQVLLPLDCLPVHDSQVGQDTQGVGAAPWLQPSPLLLQLQLVAWLQRGCSTETLGVMANLVLVHTQTVQWETHLSTGAHPEVLLKAVREQVADLAEDDLHVVVLGIADTLELHDLVEAGTATS